MSLFRLNRYAQDGINMQIAAQCANQGKDNELDSPVLFACLPYRLDILSQVHLWCKPIDVNRVELGKNLDPSMQTVCECLMGSFRLV